MGYEAIASVHAPANTLVLAQKRAMAFVDFNKLQVENLVDADQAKEGFQNDACERLLSISQSLSQTEFAKP
jgi:hypothetical protein